MSATGQSVNRSTGQLRRISRRLLDYGVIVLVFVVAMALYVRTMAPGLLDGDEGEFQINIYKLGVSHTGYPTFFLLGKLWTMLVPVGTIATRANLFSAFWGAVTIAAVYVLIRFLTRSGWAAAISALLLLGSRVEWSQSVIPRPYTLNSLFVVLVPLLFFLWRVGKVDLTLPVFAFGLSLTNHRTIMWFAPAIGLFILIADYRAVFGDAKPNGNWLTVAREWIARSELLKPRRLLALIAAFVLPLLLYSYVWWRGESDVGVEFHWKDFNDEIMGGYVRASWRFGPLDWLVSRVTELYIPMLIEQFTALGSIAGLVGMVALALDKPPRGWHPKLPAREALLFILLANLVNAAFCVIFWVIDIDKFFLPSFITFLFFIGVGIAVISDQLKPKSKQLTRVLTFTVYCLLIAAFAFLVITNLPLNDWSRRTDVAAAWEENLTQPLEPNAVIVGSWESITPLEYAMYVEGRRRDLERWKVIIQNYQLGQVPYDSRQTDIEKAVRGGRPVYLTVHPGETETLTALPDEFRLTRVGELWRVLDMPPTDTATIARLRTVEPLAVFKDSEERSLELLDCTIRPGRALTAGDFGLATLYWRAPQTFSERLAISVRLTDAQNHLIAQRDSEPASGLRSTVGWSPNEIVQDDVAFIIPPDAPPGVYHLTVVVYNTATGENWTAGGALYSLADLQVTRPAQPTPREVLTIPHQLDLAVSPFHLLGYALDGSNFKGGDTFDLSLWWQDDETTPLGGQVNLALRDESGRTANLYSGTPIPNFPASEWGHAAILRGRYTIQIPIDFSGTSRLTVESQGQTTPIATFNVQPSGRTFVVPRIRYPASAQLGDSIKLLGYNLDKTNARPGETVRVTLYWQAVKTPTASYTVFAHIVDGNGVLRGQDDSLPRHGELPTDRWLPGEVIADAHDIVIAPDAPAGEYRFEAGMYSPETGQRVPMFADDRTRATDDRVLLGGALVAQ